MKTETITITLAIDVEPGGDVVGAENLLLAELSTIILSQQDAGAHVFAAPAPYKTGHGNDYRKMRDHENDEQYTEVRVRAEVSR